MEGYSMKQSFSIYDIIAHIRQHNDYMRDILRMDYIELGVQKIKDRAKEHMTKIETDFNKVKDKIDEATQRVGHIAHSHHNELMALTIQLFQKHKDHLKKINLKDIDVIEIFKDLIQKEKITHEEAEVYIEEWQDYVQEQKKTKKPLKKFIMLLVALLFIETSIANVGHAEMTEMTENGLNNVTGRSGIAVTMSIQEQNEQKTIKKKLSMENISNEFVKFMEKIQSQTNKATPDMEIDMKDIAKDFDHIQLDSEFGQMNLSNVKIKGQGTIQIKMSP